MDSAEELLQKLGIHAIYRGYPYLVCALKLVTRNPEYLLYITKWLYPDVAKNFHSTESSVERSIRTAVNACWNEGNRELLNQLAGYDLTRKPTNGEFLSILSFYLTRRLSSQE